MILKAELKYTSGIKTLFVVDTKAFFCADKDFVYEAIDELGSKLNVSLGGEILAEDKDFLPFIFKITPFACDASFDCFTVCARFARGEELSGKTIIMGNGVHTNDFAQIHDYKYTKTDSQFMSRDTFIAKNSDMDLCCAFATFNRFFTRFNTSNGSVIAFYNLENKVVKQGQILKLEHLFITENISPEVFMEFYTKYLAKTHDIPDYKYTPRGWSQWSCYYNFIDEEKAMTQSKMVAKELLPFGADMIQLDDGWEEGSSFADYWTSSKERFPGGIKEFGKKINDMNLRLGLWIAPGLISENSPKLADESVKDKIVKMPDGKIEYTFGNVYPYDISREDVIEETKAHFNRLLEEYKACYFKIDFLTNLVGRVGMGNLPVEYPGGYCVEVYKKWIQEIRNTVGPDTFLLSCGAPIGESIGVFDAVRVSPDISFSVNAPGHPGSFMLIAMDAQNALRRSYYHHRVFINDPDALIVRDYQTEYSDDGVVLSDDEAKYWATNVFMSGGHVLLNEDYYKLSENRQELVKRTIQLSAAREQIDGGCAARPRDLMEKPYCTESFVAHEAGVSSEEMAKEISLGGRIKNGDVIIAYYNPTDEIMVKTFRVQDYFADANREYFGIEMFTEAECEPFKKEKKFELAPHSSLCVKFRKV